MAISQTLFFKAIRSKLIPLWMLVLSLTLSTLTAPAWADTRSEEQEVNAAVSGLYRALSDQDAKAFCQFLVPQGFTEFNPDWSGVRRLDMNIFKRIFESGAKIDLSVAGLQVQTITGTTAIATGYRAGAITPPGEAPIKSRLALSMIWTKHLGQWKLQHVHLSEVKTN